MLDQNALSRFFQQDSILETRASALFAECRSAGLTVSQKQALALAEAQTSALEDTGRIEIAGGAAAKLLLAFDGSAWIDESNFEAVYSRLIAIFYEMKNETHDRIGDDELIDYLQRTFETVCRGSTKLLRDHAENDLVRRRGYPQQGGTAQ